MEQNVYLDKTKLDEIESMVNSLIESMDIDGMKARLRDLNDKQMEEGFWDDTESAQKTIKEFNHYNRKIENLKSLTDEISSLKDLLEIMEMEGDYSSYKDFKDDLIKLEKHAEDFKIATLLNDKYDDNDVILQIHAGAGGTEAQDWASMLLRMYTRYCEQKGFSAEILDLQKEDEAGIKSATLLIKGDSCYGYLKGEKGVHRLVRISPFDSNKRRHTSFSSVDVYPELEDVEDVDIKPEDLKIDTYRSSGAGGQHVNTTDSAVRITHIPTGIVVSCQDEKSQLKNKDKAMKILKSRLYDKMLEEQNKDIADARKSQVGSGDRSERIRTYNFPQGRVTDHRINMTIYQLQDFLDGEIGEMIDALITYDQTEKLKLVG